ncbi:MAG: glycosyltransferase family 4 protein [Acidobacteria bacterium]|nr:glycosyltransferase family 4 protein [Acidobacteriota bacterium]
MRIAIEASTWVNRRGYGRFTRELTRALLRAASDHQLTLVLDSGAASASDLPPAERLTVPTRRAVVDAASSEGSRSLVDIWRMTRALSRTAFDAILFPTVYSYVPVFSRAQVVVIIHDALPEAMPDLVLGSRRARMFWDLKMRLACRRADTIATVSAASAREIRRRIPVGGKPICVLGEGIGDPFSPRPSSADAGRLASMLPRAGRFLLYVGGFSPHKRVPDLIEAFRHLAAGGYDDLFLILAGPSATDRFRSDEQRIAAAIDGLGSLASRVIRTGYVPDETLAALYRDAACVVLPSAGEGFGLTALEAMASGAPLVVRRSPALEELCGDAAEYVDETRSMAEALRVVLDDRSRADELHRRGPDRAGRHDWNGVARQTLALIEGRSPC